MQLCIEAHCLLKIIADTTTSGMNRLLVCGKKLRKLKNIS